MIRLKYTFEVLLIALALGNYLYGGHTLLTLVPPTLAYALCLYRSFKARLQMGEMILSLEKVKNALSGTGEQIEGSCALLEDSTHTQSSAIFESSAASDEISAMLVRASANVKQVGESSTAINQIIDLSSRYAKELEVNFNEGQHNNEKVMQMLGNTVALLKELTTLFAEVVSKTGVINDIVFQTKLLSFNASVEAARAGEHGKGFAVVAEEIGNLAQMSGASAKSINQTLDQTDARVNHIIGNIEQMGQELEDRIKKQNEATVRILGDFNHNFHQVQQGTQAIGHEIDSLGQASDEQARGVGELRQAIHEVNESIQKNTLVVSQTLRLSNVLASEMKSFEAMLANFKESINLQVVTNIDEIPWEDKYLIGVTEMDHQHQNLLAGINELIRAMNEKSMKEVKKCYQGLYQVVQEHFSDEEALMQQKNYPSYESHKKVHENLLAKLLSFMPAIEAGTLDRAMLASFLRNWLFTHIMGIDSKYAEHFHEHDHYERKVVKRAS